MSSNRLQRNAKKTEVMWCTSTRKVPQRPSSLSVAGTRGLFGPGQPVSPARPGPFGPGPKISHTKRAGPGLQVLGPGWAGPKHHSPVCLRFSTQIVLKSTLSKSTAFSYAHNRTSSLCILDQRANALAVCSCLVSYQIG